MCAPKLPEPPDPRETAAAATGTNIATAQANAALGNVNQVTPYGSLTYSQTGQTFINDPNGGQKWWKGPNGELTQTAPAGYSAPTTSTEKYQYGGGGDNGLSQERTRTTTTPGSGGMPEGWSEVSGYYVPNYTQTQTMSEGEQKVYDSGLEARQNLANIARDQSGRIGEHLSTPFSLDGAPAAGDPSKMAGPNYQGYSAGQKLATTFGDAGPITKTYGTDFSEDRQRVEDALMERMQTQLDRDQGRLDQKLANQGIRIGSDAFSSGQADFGRNVNDARMAAILAGGQEQSRLTGLERDRAMFENSAQEQNYGQLFGRATFGNNATQGNNDNQFRATSGNNQNETARMNAELAKIQAQNAARSQYVQEQLTLRNQPINETTALMSGSQVQQPNFQPTNMPTIPTVDMAGLINDNYQQRSNNAMAQYQAKQGVLGGIFGLGANMIAASDRRVKKDVKKIGKTDDGQNLYFFRYKGDDRPQIGLIAQEVEKRNPDAVHEIRGVKHVDYGKALDGLFAYGAAA